MGSAQSDWIILRTTSWTTCTMDLTFIMAFLSGVAKSVQKGPLIHVYLQDWSINVFLLVSHKGNLGHRKVSPESGGEVFPDLPKTKTEQLSGQDKRLFDFWKFPIFSKVSHSYKKGVSGVKMPVSCVRHSCFSLILIQTRRSRQDGHFDMCIEVVTNAWWHTVCVCQMASIILRRASFWEERCFKPPLYSKEILSLIRGNAPNTT